MENLRLSSLANNVEAKILKYKIRQATFLAVLKF